MTTDELLALLADPECPFSAEPSDVPPAVRGRRQPARSRLIALPDLADFARRRHGDHPGLESEIDRLMAGLGARRSGYIDPWSAPRRLLRRLAGKPVPRMVAYDVPEDVAATGG